MKVSWACVQLLLAALPVAAHGEDTPDDVRALLETGAAPMEWKLRLDGQLSFPTKEPQRKVFSEEALLVSGSAELSPSWKLAGELEAFHSSQGVSGDNLFNERSPTRPALGFRELYAGYSGDGVALRAGILILSWGKGDAYPLLNLANPMDYAYVLEPRKIGVPAVDLTVPLGKLELTVALSPLFVPARLPVAGSQYDFLAPGGSIRDDPYPGGAQFAAQLASYGSDIDLSIAYAFRRDAGGRLRAFLEGGRPVLARSFDSTHQLGIGASFPAGPFEAHFETVGRTYPGSPRFEGSIQYLAGLNWVKPNLLGDESDLTLAVEYLRTDDRRPTGSDLFAERQFESAVALRAALALSSRVTVETKLIGDVQDAGYFLSRTRTQYRLRDGFRIEAGYELLSASPTSFFRQLNDRDRLFLGLRLDL